MAKKKKKAVKKKKIALKKRAVKRKVALKPRKRKPVAKKRKAPVPAAKPKEQGTAVGKITHYFPHVQAAVIKLKAPLAAGDTIKVKGHTTDFTQTVTSMQIDHVVVSAAKKGEEIGLQVNSRVRQHDMVYKI